MNTRPRRFPVLLRSRLKPRSGRTVLLALSFSSVLITAGTQAFAAGAADQPVVASKICCSYNSPAYALQAGQVAKFRNDTPAGVTHTATADETTGYGAFFGSKIIASNKTTAIAGSEYLEAGVYKFHCDIHGFSMRSKLVVTGNAAKQRPGVKALIPPQSLDKLSSSSKLRVAISENAAPGRGVKLVVRVSGSKVGQLIVPGRLAAKAGKTYTVPLTNVRMAIPADSNRAKVAVTAYPRFGAPASAKRTLR